MLTVTCKQITLTVYNVDVDMDTSGEEKKNLKKTYGHGCTEEEKKGVA